MPEVTAILLQYKRPEKLARLIDALKGQTEKPEIMVIDNGPQPFTLREVGKYVRIPWNAGCWIRLAFARYTATDWIVFMDDDVLPADGCFVEDALRIAQERPQAITGAFGRTLAFDPPHYRDDAIEYVHIIKGRFVIFNKALLEKVTLHPYGGEHDPRFLEDIFLSLQVGGCHPVHWADLGLQRRIIEQSSGGQDGLGVSEEFDHLQRRGDFCRWYLEKVA